MQQLQYKLIQRKKIASLPELGRVCERIVVQLAHHDFKCVVDGTLKYLFDATQKDQEQLV